MNEEIYRARAKIMKALAHPARLMILDHLAGGDRCLCELQPLFSQDKSTLSRHITDLRNAGILTERREGTRVYLRLATPCILGIFDCVTGVMQAEAQRTARLMEATL